MLRDNKIAPSLGRDQDEVVTVAFDLQIQRMLRGDRMEDDRDKEPAATPDGRCQKSSSWRSNFRSSTGSLRRRGPDYATDPSGLPRLFLSMRGHWPESGRGKDAAGEVNDCPAHFVRGEIEIKRATTPTRHAKSPRAYARSTTPECSRGKRSPRLTPRSRAAPSSRRSWCGSMKSTPRSARRG